jgi:cytochrome c
VRVASPYLSAFKRYQKMKFVFTSIAVSLLLPSSVALADMDEMYKTKNCFACHRIERTYLGPSFKSIATKYAGEKDADVKLTKRVIEGGSGSWGNVPMPAQTQVTQAEALALVRWVLEQK